MPAGDASHSEFSPTAMSPIALTAPVPCELPYGLTWAHVASVLPGVDTAAVDRCRAFRQYAKQGRFQGSDSSSIVTLQYPTVAGTCTQTVFVKQTPVGQAEARHYALLKSSGVPTPDLLGAVDADGREVIITEFLPTIGVDLSSAQEIEALLAEVARLNAVPVVAGSHEPPPGRPRAEMDRLRRAGLTVLAADPRTGVEVDRWFDAFDRLRRSTPPLPEALTHGEFGFQQCGWAARDNNRQLVLFDLATMGRRPRFADLTSVLPIASDSIGVSELELLETYLVALRSHTGITVSPPVALAELVTYRALNGFSALYWLTHDVYEAGSDELVEVAHRLARDLATAGVGPDV